MHLLMTAPCLLGLEGLVADELKFMEAENVSAKTDVSFLRAMRLCLQELILTAALQKEFLLFLIGLRLKRLSSFFNR